MLRYDPARIGPLLRHVRAAADDLVALGALADDPAAGVARLAVAIARHRIEHEWLPLLERIAASDAMLSWHATTPPAIDLAGLPVGLIGRFATRTGADLGHDLADRARRLTAGLQGDDGTRDVRARLGEATDDLDALLAGHRDDTVAIDAFLDALGGSGIVDLLVALGARLDATGPARALATTVRACVADASRRPRFPAGFATALVDRTVEHLSTGSRATANPAAALSFLVSGPEVGTGFLVAATAAVVDHELAVAAADPRSGPARWGAATGLGAPPSTLAPPTARHRDDHPDFVAAGDPMAALLDALAADGAAGRRVFTDERVARYLFAERDDWADGLRRVSVAAATAAAGPDVTGGGPAVARDAAQVASAYVNHLASRGRDHLVTVADHPPVQEAAASILARHMDAVHQTVLLPGPVDPPAGVVVPFLDEALGDGVVGVAALFDEHALDVITELAVGCPAGVATLRAGLDVHQQARALAGVGRIASGDVADGDRFLREAVADAARLEAHLVAHVGHRAEAMGRSLDDAVTFWTDVATVGVGGLDVPIVGDALGPAAAALTERFATHRADAARTAEQDAAAAADRLLHVWHRQLYRQAVVVPDLPAVAVDDGELVAWSDLQRLPPADVRLVRNLLEETTGLVNLDGGALRDVIRLQQLPVYQQLR